MSTIRLTLNQSMEEVIAELEQAYKPMSRTEILKMTVAEFYNSRFGKTSKKKTKRSSKQNVQLVNKWIQTKQEPNLSAEELENAFGDWWAENKAELRA